MGKEHELSMLIDELKKCGETLVGISGELAVFFSGADAEKSPAKKADVKKKAVRDPKAGVQKEKELTLEMSGLFVQIRPAKAIPHRSRQSLISMVWEDCPM